MVDPISIAKDIISFGLTIKEIVDEVNAFKEDAKLLQYKIKHLMPPLETIAEMENQREALAAAQKREPEMKAFTNSLSDMQSLVGEVKAFIKGLKGMSKFQQATKKEKIKGKFKIYGSKLDTLQQSIHMGVLVEFKKEADAGRKRDSVKILVRHVKKASASHGSSTAGAKRESRSADNVPIIASDDLEIERKIGKGGFGEVWLANYKHGERVAVKIFDVGNNRSVLKEVSKMRQAIFSPYIVRLRGLVDEPETHGIVMDYFKYGNLKSFLPYLECDCWPRRLRMLCDMASGINYLHTDLMEPLVHRDIKLANMFVDHGFTVKIGDLGLASSGTTITKSRSQAYLKGTYSHMAPELWAGTTEEAEPSLDIYGFGISMYEFITGKSPWPPAVKLDQISGLVLSGRRPDLAFVKPDTPSEVVTMMKKCWQTDPKSRPTSPEILRSFSMLYESRYEAELSKADRVIRRKIERKEGASLKQQGDLSEGDSGIKSDFQDSFDRLNVEDQDTTVKASATGGATSDSGIAAMIVTQIAPLPPPKRATTRAPSPQIRTTSLLSRPRPTKKAPPPPPLHRPPPPTPPPPLHRPAAAATGSTWSDSGIAAMTAVDESNMTWQYKQTIRSGAYVEACQMISPNHVAVCITGCVKVYDVSAKISHLMYTVSIEEWKGKFICGVAVSESLPSSMLVICHGIPYVYQCASCETTQMIKKYKIESNEKNPWGIVANANTAVIKITSVKSFIVCRLPGFTQQSSVQLDFNPYDLSISSEYLVIMGREEMLVRSLSDERQDVCRIKLPVGWRFGSVCCRNNAREIYAACGQGEYPNIKYSLYRYTWGGAGKPQYGNPTHNIIKGLDVGFMCLSVTSDGLLAVGQGYDVKIYRLQ